MPRVKKPAKVKEPIRLRMKELANGNKSLYLDIYRDGKRTYEYLKMYLIPETDNNARVRNQTTMAAANAIKSKRIIQLTNGEAGIETREKVFSSGLDGDLQRESGEARKERWEPNPSYYPHPERFCRRTGNDGSDRQGVLPRVYRLSID